jgi:phosphinothricin acetyltransferase
VKLRLATRDDVEPIRAIYNQAVLTTTATYDMEPRTHEQQLAWFVEEHERIGFPVFVAETESGQVVGWCSLGRYRPRPGYRFTAEDSIYIDEAYRGQGIGTQLLPLAIDAASNLGMHAIMAVLDAESEASMRLHTRFGFKEVGRLPEVGHKFERWLDVVYLQLLLVH